MAVVGVFQDLVPVVGLLFEEVDDVLDVASAFFVERLLEFVGVLFAVVGELRLKLSNLYDACLPRSYAWCRCFL